MAPQTQVGFYISAEEAAGTFSKLQFWKAFSSLKLQKEINRKGGKKAKPSFCSSYVPQINEQ